MTAILQVEDHTVKVSNPEKYLWPELGIRKVDYISHLIKLAPYIIPYSSNRILTTIRYPDGIDGKFFYQKSIPNYAPDWIPSIPWNKTSYILLNSLSTLVWLGNQAALELHTAFNSYHKEDYPTFLVFDLDPSEGQVFDEVVHAALLVHEALEGLAIKSWVKTSGATGLQIYIPTGEKYDYNRARKMNAFFGKYFSQKFPELFTIERVVSRRGKKLYFDYLQMWHGKSIAAPYSPRATKWATVSTPVEWAELKKKSLTPQDFTLLNIMERLNKKGDLFQEMLNMQNVQNLNPILSYLGEV